MPAFFKGAAAVLFVLLAGLAAWPALAQSYGGTRQDPYLVIQAPDTAPSYPTAVPVSASAAPPAASATAADYHNVSSAPGYGPATLDTKTGIQLGLQGSYYDYREPGYGVRLNGAKVGFDAIGNFAVNDGYFLTADIRDALGNSDYSGSGHDSGNFENLLDARGLIGRDFNYTDVSLSPYLGFGYRRLSSDDRGISSTGAAGYQRTNQIYYLPLGITPRVKLGDDSRIAATAEYDVFLHGKQESELGNANAALPTLNNSQNSGYGVRGNIMFETGNWSLGPFVTYWNVDRSETSCASSRTVTACGFEPANHTLETGFQVFYKFL